MHRIITKIKKLRLNFFDIAVIIAIIVVLSVFLYLRVSKKSEWINVRIVASNDEWWWEGQPPQWWYVDDLEKGMSSYNSLGEKVAEIENLEVFDVGGYKRRAFIDVKLNGAFDNKRKIYLYNFQPLQVGKPIDLTFGKHNIKGLITYIENAPIAYSSKKIEVKLLAVQPWVAESLTEGLEMKDSQGQVLAKIDKVESKIASTYEFSDIRGQNIIVSDPSKRDVRIELTIKTFKSGNTEHFLDRAAIKIGEKIWFQFPQTVIRDAEITRIY